MILLALQFGAQPILTKSFTPKTISRSTVVLMQEVTKFVVSAGLLLLSGRWAASVAGWTPQTWMVVAGLPAALYVVQNYCALMAYQNLPPVTFNVLNQTKTMSAALWCYLLMGRKQSKLQIISLLILSLAALVLEKVVPLPFLGTKKDTTNREKDTGATKEASSTDLATAKQKAHIVSGVVPVLMASLISGLAGALSQKSLQIWGRNSYFFSLELSAASLLILGSSLLAGSNPDSSKIANNGFWHGWTLGTWIPVGTNACGGILVGLVTKHAGSVRKGFALIFGLLLSGIFQAKLLAGDEDNFITMEQVAGGVLAALSLWMHSTFPVATV
jgi:UDP-sugar transporter A1/2/3